MIPLRIVIIFLVFKIATMEPVANIDIPTAREDIESLLQQHPGHPGLTAALSSIELNRSSTNASVLVLGLDGAGKSATIQNIFKIPLSYEDNDATTIREHTIHIPLHDKGISNSYIKILDTPGFADGKTAEQDAAVLTTIQNYLNSSEGLSSRFPTTVLVISRFDDNRASGINSNFVQMLKRVEYLKASFGSSNSNINSNIIFVFTYLLSSTNTESRRPNTKLKNFKSTIQNFTNFPSPIVVTVGENRYESYELEKQDGYYKLPNKELFPKNILVKMIESSEGIGDSIGQFILQEALNTPDLIRSSTERVIPVETGAQSEQVSYGIRSQSLGIQQTELSGVLQEAFSRLDSNLKLNFPTVLQTILRGFQIANISTLQQIPDSEKEKVAFLRTLPFNSAVTELLQHAFGWTYPELVSFSVLGSGYDVLGDTSLFSSPFDMSEMQPSPLGFSIPSVASCTMVNEDHDIFHLLSNYESYSLRRQEEMSATFDPKLFSGPLQSGYNSLLDKFNLSDYDRLSSVRQTRQFILQLTTSPPFNSEFIERIQSLAPFSSGIKESATEWKSFFNEFGTHVVSSAYGGGYMESSIAGVALELLLKDQSTTQFRDLRQSFPFFTNLPASLKDNPEVAVSFRFFGGSANSKMERISALDENERDVLLNEWKESLKTEPVIFKSLVTLTPLSVYIRQYNESIGESVEIATKLLLEGNLKYQRPKTNKTRPQTSTSQGQRNSSAQEPAQNNVPNEIQATPTPQRVSPDSHSQDRRGPSQPTKNNEETVNRNAICDHYTERPAQFCPTPKPCSTTPAPIWQYQRICPTTTAAPIKTATSTDTKPCPNFIPRFDNPNNYVGQGYHMLHDVILETSPLDLKLKMYDDGFPASVAFNIKELDRTCFIGVVKLFQNYQQYATERMKAVLPIDYQTTSGFKGSIKPGYNVISLEGKRTIKTLKEKRTHKISLKEQYTFNTNFMQDADNLPYYSYRECQSSGAWKRFFDKYGTHLVTMAYLGTARDDTLLGISVQKWKRDNLHYNQALCLASPDLSLDRLANEMFTPLRIGMKVEMIGKVLGLRNPSQQVDALSALTDLVDNKLHEC